MARHPSGTVSSTACRDAQGTSKKGLGSGVMMHGWKGYAIGICKIVLGITFLLSAVPKLRMPHFFLSNIYGFEMVGPEFGVFLAVSIPWLEFVLAMLLLGDILASGALLLSAGMGAMFTCAQAAALYRGLDISCGCFQQTGAGKVSYLTLLKALAVFLMAAFAYLISVIRTRRGETDDG